MGMNVNTTSGRLCVAAGVGSALIAMSACGGGSTASSGSSSTPIVIGIVMPYSGAESYYGQYADNAWTLAMRQYGSSIGGHPIKLVKADSKCEPTAAVTAVHDVLAQNPVAIMAPACSADTLAIIPIITAAHVPLASENLAVKVTQQGSHYVWDVQPNDGVTNKLFGAWLIQQGYTKVGIVHDTTAYGAGNASTLSDSLTAAGHPPVVDVSYDLSSTDYSGQILALKNASISAAYLEGYDLQSGQLVKQARSLGLTVPLFAPTSATDSTFLSAAGTASAEGTTVVTSFLASSSPAATTYAQATQAFGYAANEDSAGIYEDAVVILKALQKVGAGASSTQLNSAIGAITLTGLPEGQVSFQSDGEVVNPQVIVTKWQNGKVSEVTVLSGQG
ncbi:MAG: branched-chain amino acid ABC transporter substrate-binding protein [Candidatus Dormibacteria bacterium]